MSVRARWSGLLVVAAYVLVVAVYFNPVVFRGRSLLTTPINPGTLPTGPWGSREEDIARVVKHRRAFIDPGSSAWTSEPWTALVSALYHRGELPLWNPHNGFGMPLAGNMQSGAFFPARLPLFVSPAAAVWNAYLLLRFVVMGVSMYALLRLWRLSVVAAFAGGVAFAFTGHFVLYANMWHLDVEMLLPSLVLLAERLVRLRSWSAAAALALGLGLTILGGSPESTLFVWLFVGAYYLFRLVSTAAASGEWRSAVRGYVMPFVTGVVLAIALTAPLLVLFVEYVVHGYSPIHQAGSRTGLSHNAWQGAVALLVPYLFDQFNYVRGVVPGLDGHSVTPYLGVVPVTLALLVRLEGKALFLAAYAAVSLLKTYGAPGVNLIGLLPVFDKAIFPKYNQPIVAFCVAALMALALDRVARTEGRPGVPRLGAALAIPPAVIAAFVGYHAESITRIGRWKWVWQEIGKAAAVLVILAALLLLARFGRGSIPLASAAGIAGLLLVELFVYVPRRLPPRLEAFRAAPYVEMLGKDEAVFRVYGLDAVLYPNTSAAFGLDDVRSLEALYPDGYLALAQRSLDRDASDRFVGGSVQELERGHVMLDLMNVRYILSWRPLGSLAEAVAKATTLPLTRFFIGGAWKTVVFQHPPSEVTYSLRVPQGGGRLRFSVGMAPTVWRPDLGDGATYTMTLVDARGRIMKVFEAAIDPKNRPEDRRWHDGNVDVTPYAGQSVTLVLRADPWASDIADHGGWGDLRLEEPGARFHEVYDAEVKVYRNEHALGRAFVVHRVEVAPSREAALARVTAPAFEPASLAVLEAPLPAGETLGVSAGAGSDVVRVVAHEPRRVLVDARLEAPGLLVLSDTDYPGWTATVDGTDATIHRADYLFRGVYLPAGTHRVEFRYRPRNFYVASVVSALALIVVAGLLWRGRAR